MYAHVIVGAIFIIVGLIFTLTKTAHIGGENDPEPAIILKGGPATAVGLVCCAIGVAAIILGE